MILTRKLLASIAAFAWACIGILLVMLAALVPAIFALRAIGIPSDYRFLVTMLLVGAIFILRPSLSNKFHTVFDRLIFPFGSPIEIMRKEARDRL